MILPTLEQDKNIYLLLDAAKISDVIRRVVAVCSTDPITPIYAGTQLQDILAASPLLIHVGDFEQYTPLFQDTEILAGCLVIQSSFSYDTMIKFWQANSIAYFPSGDIPAIFRLHDPVFYAAFQNTEFDLDKVRLSGPCEHVWVWDGNQRTWNDYPQELIEGVDLDFRPIELTDTLMAVMTEVKVHHVIRLLSIHIKTYFPQMFEENESAEPLAKFLFKKSSSLGFSGQQSLFFFANIWCYLGSNCLNEEEYPEIANKLLQPSIETPQQRISQAALKLENYKQNLIHRQYDYI